MNNKVWIEAFEKLGSEISFNLSAHKSLLQETRHHEFKEMTIHSMFGKFYCSNPKCKSKSQNSTKCNTDIKYRYNPNKKQGEIQISREYGQYCNKCEKNCIPKSV